ncbi:MAG: class I SAM-dependent methyltransferase [Pyrinomonadaceae bacterium]
MRFTGERVIPDRYELKPMLQEHLVRYEFALPRVQGKDVLDLGCGCGYGSHLMATSGARSVVGVDLANDALEYAQKNYRVANLKFEQMDVTALKYPSERFSTVVCLEVFEHVRDYEALLRESVRVLKPGGTLVLSTPNKLVWSPHSERPINPWHFWEFNREDFGRIMDSHLDDVQYWCQTNSVPGIIPFILINLRLQGYYVRSKSRVARAVEWLHGTAMKIAMLPPNLIPGAMDKNPNAIVPETEVPPKKQHYFVAVGQKTPGRPPGLARSEAYSAV